MQISKAILILSVVTSALVGGIGGSWIVIAQQTPMLSPQDYLEIQQLYFLYSRDVDPGSQRDASWMYTSDGVFGAGTTKRSGQKDLKEFYEQVRKDQYSGVRHFTSNLVIIPTPEGAKTSSYMMTVERREPSGPGIITGFGTYEDRLAKTSAGWRFKERVFRGDSYRTAPRAQ